MSAAAASPGPAPAAAAAVHLDFVVDDAGAAVQRALAADATLEQPVADHAWGRLALLADPFGNGLCFVRFVGRGCDEIADPA